MRTLHIKNKFPSILFAFLCTILLFIAPPTGQAAITDETFDVPTDKTWTITFNSPVDAATVNLNTIYVTDASGVKQSGALTVSNDKTQVTVAPPAGGYAHSATYTLHITSAVRGENGKFLSGLIQKRFTIVAPPPYDVATIQPDGSLSVIRTYPNYDAAVAALGANQAILQAGKVIKMPGGLVTTKPTSQSSLTIIYTDKQLKRQETYIPADTELIYIDSTDAYVEVNVAGIPRFIKHENSELIPQQAVRDRSYYYRSGDALYHSIYSHGTKKFATYNAGAAPSFMRAGERYYSADGSHFTAANGQNAGVAYQYFQYLPIRSVTPYTSEEIDAYIVAQLNQLEAQNPNNPTYRNASVKSKLLGIGSILKKAEAEHHVNALHILALAQHESTYGLSDRAQQYNNLFGLYVTDDNPAAKYFDSVEQNIEELITAFWNKNYLPPNGAYAYGAVLGNKAIGMNVKYASDPYWGAKAAGHLYRIDRAMGSKEAANAYKLGLTNTTGLNVRNGPGTNHPIAYTYAKSGMPLILLDDMLPDSPWFKVRSDSTQYNELYVHGSYVYKLPVIK
ncbi:endo-beta-n-acetylglucosaminidase [Bacillus sp. OxB-1]|uniref:glucosaminidase domain-containing protein n=1 Tax=Bacillus sp. (strain OxB-1) TaxID=98228 RepID=UPI00058230FE|nr:glucosaminidase domain-containing protein [Bacillus sp. OxB-1]BAQ10057.1 endo-beta-n-acetylglucosaminidase [Bacillus sp. OxB-1]